MVVDELKMASFFTEGIPSSPWYLNKKNWTTGLHLPQVAFLLKEIS